MKNILLSIIIESSILCGISCFNGLISFQKFFVFIFIIISRKWEEKNEIIKNTRRKEEFLIELERVQMCVFTHGKKLGETRSERVQDNDGDDDDE